MAIYCNDKKYAKEFVIPITENKDEAEVEVYVLLHTMSPLDLMKAFRACRINPMKAWYYIPSEPAEFHDYAYDAIKRGTLNIYHDWDVLMSALSGDIISSAETEISKCVQQSVANFGYEIDYDTCKFLSGAVYSATERYGAFPACKALLKMLESGRRPNVPLYNEVMKSSIMLYASVESAVNEFRQTGSHILGVLAGEKIYKLFIEKQSEFDRVAIHILFQPLTPDVHDLHERRSQLVRVAKENGK